MQIIGHLTVSPFKSFCNIPTYISKLSSMADVLLYKFILFYNNSHPHLDATDTFIILPFTAHI